MVAFATSLVKHVLMQARPQLHHPRYIFIGPLRAAGNNFIYGFYFWPGCRPSLAPSSGFSDPFVGAEFRQEGGPPTALGFASESSGLEIPTSRRTFPIARTAGCIVSSPQPIA